MWPAVPAKEKFKAAMLTAHRTGELHKVAGDLAQEVRPRTPRTNRVSMALAGGAAGR